MVPRDGPKGRESRKGNLREGAAARRGRRREKRRGRGRGKKVRYFWRLLDVGEKGRIDAFAIAFFFRDVAAAIQDEGYDAPCVADVVDEIFDMVKPQNAAFITVDDLLKCKVARTVITMLVDVAGFLAYDNREHLAHAPEDDDF